MIILLDDLIKKYNIKINGIIHVGAHECEEIIYYDKHIERNKVLWIEAQEEKVAFSKKKYENILIERAIVSDKIEIVTFNVANNGQSSSILELDLHKIHYLERAVASAEASDWNTDVSEVNRSVPYIKYTQSYNVQTNTLKNIISKYADIPFNFMNLDIQGVELNALKGMEEQLENIDYIYTEVNRKCLYKDCALIDDIDEYVKQFNFIRVETRWTDSDWGDAFYIKENKYIKKDKYVIFKPSGRLGNAIFIYLASVVMCIKHNLKYILDEDYNCNCNCSGVNEKYEYYKGVDHINDDVTCVYNESIQNIMRHSDMNDKVLCFNTLGYLKNNINLQNLQSNQYINNENGHGLFVKNNITVTDENFLYFLDKNVSHANIIMYGQFQHDQLFLEYKIDILQFIEKNKNSHYIKTDRQQKFLIKDIVDDVVLPQSKIYDIVIHIRLGDFNGRPDFIEYEYYEKLFESIDFYDKKICIVVELVTNENDKRFLEKCINWFETKNLPIHIESNELLIDFNIMKQTKILVCSMSTLSWMAAYFSKILEKCYMPNYILYGDRKHQAFKKPIENTVLYDVKSTLFL